eukprot:gene11550-13483_t
MREYGIHDEDAISFITSLLKLDPKERISLGDALVHPFLRTGKQTFEAVMADYIKQNKGDVSSSIPADISELTDTSVGETTTLLQTVTTKDTTDTATTTSKTEVEITKPTSPSIPKIITTEPPTTSTPTNTSETTTTSTPTTPTTTDVNKSNKTPPWSYQKPLISNQAPAMILSPQRVRSKFKLFPSLLPSPTSDSPEQDTMIWRNPPLNCKDDITWNTIAHDPIFQVQHGVLTSILKTFSHKSDYEYRIITQTKSPVEIAVSNHKDSILYMYNIVKSVVTPQLISLSASSNESSIHRALCSILQQLDSEQEQISFSSGWTVLL